MKLIVYFESDLQFGVLTNLLPERHHKMFGRRKDPK